MRAHAVLKLEGPTDPLRLCWQVGETMLLAVAFPGDAEDTRYQVLLALQEIVTNILRHGYDGEIRRPLELAFAADAEGFEVTVRDQGPAFDPLAYDTAPVACADGMPTQVGGFGIHIARLVMDALSYQRVDGWNELRMHKRARTAAAVP